MRSAATILEETGHLRLPHYREEHKLLYRRFTHGVSVICVHLHEAVNWGRVLILRGDDVIDRSGPSRDGPYGIASPGDLLMITLAHCLYETDRIRMSDMRAVRQACSSPSFDWDTVFRAVDERGWTTGFRASLLLFAAFERALHDDPRIPSEIVTSSRITLGKKRWARGHVRRVESALERGSVSSPLPISRAYSKMHTLARLLGEAERSPDMRLADVIAMAWNLVANRLKVRCRPAIIITLSGLDGSGKSVVSNTLGDAMRLCEVPVRIVWSRGGFSPLMEMLKRAARAPAAAPGPGDSEAKRRWLGGRLRGIDTAVDLVSKLGRRRLSTRSAGLVMALSPSPDLGILLRVTPRTAMARKPEDDHRDLAERARGYDDLAASTGLLVVDAERPLGEVAGEVVEAGLRIAFCRFEGSGGR
jgi:thymidylate kinase